MKKNKKIKEEFSKHDLMFPDLTQLRLEKEQLEAYKRMSNYVGHILSILLILAKKIRNIEMIISNQKIKKENKNGKK